MGCAIVGCGKSLPALQVSNDDLATIVETSDEWIVERTGIHNRRIAATETGTQLATSAARQALGIDEGGWSASGQAIDPASIDLIICGTMTSDSLIPSQAGWVRQELGSNSAIAFDINTACTGCIYGVSIAEAMMRASHLPAVAGHIQGRRNTINRALVIGVERLSRITDWTDRSTCVLFGDGAGALLLEWDEDQEGILSSYLKNTDDVGGSLALAHLGDFSTFPFEGGPEGKGVSYLDALSEEEIENASPSRAAVSEPNHFVHMLGQEVFKFASLALVDSIKQACELAGISPDDLQCIVPHQANERIIRYAAKRLHKPLELFQISMGEVGNTSAASVPMALTDAYLSGRIHPGDLVALSAFGGGLTAGALVFKSC